LIHGLYFVCSFLRRTDLSLASYIFISQTTDFMGGLATGRTGDEERRMVTFMGAWWILKSALVCRMDEPACWFELLEHAKRVGVFPMGHLISGLHRHP